MKPFECEAGTVVTMRFVVEDPAEAGEFLARLLATMADGPTVGGVRVRATARGDVFGERNALAKLVDAAHEHIERHCFGNDEGEALLDRFERRPA